QSDTRVYDYNVHGGLTVNAGAGIAGQSSANFIGVENNQTTTGSGLPVIGGNSTITGGAVSGLFNGLTVDIGTDGSGSDFPIALHGNLAITTTGSGSANILLNDINATSGTADSITLGGGTSGNTV